MTFLLVFLALGAAWALQMLLAGRQARTFMASVADLRARGRTAIGVSSTKRMGRKTYVALAADASGLVVAASQLSGLTVWARPRPVSELAGRPLAELAADEDEGARCKAAAMAADVLLSARGDEAEEVAST